MAQTNATPLRIREPLALIDRDPWQMDDDELDRLSAHIRRREARGVRAGRMGADEGIERKR